MNSVWHETMVSRIGNLTCLSVFCVTRCSPWKRPCFTPNAVSSHLPSFVLVINDNEPKQPPSGFRTDGSIRCYSGSEIHRTRFSIVAFVTSWTADFFSICSICYRCPPIDRLLFLILIGLDFSLGSNGSKGCDGVIHTGRFVVFYCIMEKNPIFTTANWSFFINSGNKRPSWTELVILWRSVSLVVIGIPRYYIWGWFSLGCLSSCNGVGGIPPRCAKKSNDTLLVDLKLISNWSGLWFPQDLPPMVPYSIPFIGSALKFGVNPIDFLEAAYEKVISQSCGWLIDWLIDYWLMAWLIDWLIERLSCLVSTDLCSVWKWWEAPSLTSWDRMLVRCSSTAKTRTSMRKKSTGN